MMSLAAWKSNNMPKFLNLSEISINVSAIRFVLPDIAKPGPGKKPSCTVCFLDASEPHAFYGEDAEKILAFLRANAV